MTIKTAIIGASFAKQAYLPALKQFDDVEVVAIASARIESAKDAAAAFNIPNAYDDYREMLDKHSVDFVGIATPTATHAPMTLAALDAGAHVLCEKPMAMNAAEAKAMLEKAESLNRVHVIGHELRFNPNRRKIAALIASGAIGQVRHVNMVNINSAWGDPDSRTAGEWLSLESMGGGRLGAIGSHQIDLLRYWLGDVGAVSGQVAVLVPNRRDKTTGEPYTPTADDQTSFTLEMQNGALASVFLSGVSRHNIGYSVMIFGSEGTIKLSETDETLWVAKAGEDFVDLTEIDPDASLPGIGKGIWNVSVVGMMREILSAIREGTPTQKAATFADGWRCQLVMDAVRESSRERKWVNL